MNIENTSPDPQNGEDERLAHVLATLTDRMHRGEQVDLEEACEEHPDVAGELRDLWGAVMLADWAGSSADARTLDSHPPIATQSYQLPHAFGEYTLLEELGRGGMGVVYRAHQKELNRDVALKMIRNEALSSEVERQRFLAEARAVATLDHAGIVPVFEIGEINESPYFCMKLIEGKTLADRVSESVFTSRNAAAVMRQICRAVEHAHSHGVLHRDLKPSNILLDKSEAPLVTDFGLAKQTQEDSSLTRTGAVLGTPSYMSPEQASGRTDQVGAQSDVFSLGCILYFMLTGRPPFQAASAVDTLMMVVEQDPVPPRLLNRAVDRDLEMIILKCLQKPADLRYETAGALALDLEAYLADEPVSARSGRFVQIAANWFRETHHATVLENWGLLWILHSLALFIACFLTNLFDWFDITNRWYYFFLWTVGLGAWAVVFWMLRRRMGPVTFVERQIAHLWAGSMVCVAALFPLEWWLDVELLSLSPVVALMCGFVFLVKGGILSGTFYIQAAVMLLTAPVMALFPSVAHLIFGGVAAVCFFVPGVKYYRQRKKNEEKRSIEG